ncbi:MAG: ferredoxin [Actinobacteria bacterium]|nr:MAG: ferredoxin [Actinomycetota bacterium]
MSKLKWQELTPGGVITEPGNSKSYRTGDWRSRRPIWNKDACSHCMLCPIHCPDSSIKVKDKKMTGIDYDHCKGCGICANICPKNAIEMHNESEYK